MAAKRPMMTTTIMISTSVKPLLERVFIVCIILLLFTAHGMWTALMNSLLDPYCKKFVV